MRDLLEPSYFQSIDLHMRANSVSTLLIPERFLPLLERNFPGLSLKQILKLLLRKFRWLFISGQFPFSNSVKLRYQEVGLNLHSFKFRPDNRDWLELGHFAYALGYSRCCLFSLLLELEEKDFSELQKHSETRKVVATLKRGIPLLEWTFLSGKRFYRRTLRFRR